MKYISTNLCFFNLNLVGIDDLIQVKIPNPIGSSVILQLNIFPWTNVLNTVNDVTVKAKMTTTNFMTSADTETWRHLIHRSTDRQLIFIYIDYLSSLQTFCITLIQHSTFSSRNHLLIVFVLFILRNIFNCKYSRNRYFLTECQFSLILTGSCRDSGAKRRKKLEKHLLESQTSLTYDFFFFCLSWKLFFANFCIGNKDLDDCLCKALHVPLPNFRVRTFKLWNNIKTLSQLSKNIDYGVGEQCMFGTSLELKKERKNQVTVY